MANPYCLLSTPAWDRMKTEAEGSEEVSTELAKGGPRVRIPAKTTGTQVRWTFLAAPSSPRHKTWQREETGRGKQLPAAPAPSPEAPSSPRHVREGGELPGLLPACLLPRVSRRPPPPLHPQTHAPALAHGRPWGSDEAKVQAAATPHPPHRTPEAQRAGGTHRARVLAIATRPVGRR